MTPNAPKATTSSNVNHAPLLLVIGCVVFGLGSLIVKFVPIGSYAMAFWRLLIAGGIFWVLSRHYRLKLPKSRAALSFALAAGALLGFDLSLWHESIHAVGPGISTLLNSLQIFFLSAIGYFFFQERLSKLQIFSLVLAVLGVALIASPEFSHNSHAVWGFISGLASGACLATSMVFVRKTQQIETTPLFSMMLLVSVGGVLALALPTLWLDYGHILPQNGRDIILIIIYGAVMQCFAWGLIVYAIPLLSLSLTGLLLLSEPVAALVIDYFLLHKPINAVQWSGATLTLLAIYLGSIKAKP